jgi:hypothetical protein
MRLIEPEVMWGRLSSLLLKPPLSPESFDLLETAVALVLATDPSTQLHLAAFLSTVLSQSLAHLHSTTNSSSEEANHEEFSRMLQV